MPTKKPGCLAALFGIGHQTTQAESSSSLFPYGLVNQIMSPAETNFYRVLGHVIQNKYLIFPKISLREFLFIGDHKNYQTHLNRIDRKHVDFLICDTTSLQPLFAIELDDSSHRRADREQRDAFIESVLSAVALPLVRIPVRASYNDQELEVLFKNALEKRQMHIAAQKDAARISNIKMNAPVCPTHKIPMVLRTAKHGVTAGEKFWGCPKYPDCREIIRL